jgi:hypothetical protein
MRTSFYLITALSAVTLISSFKIPPPPAAPAVRRVAKSLPTYVPVPHRVTFGHVNTKELKHPLTGRGNNEDEQIPWQFCPEFFGQPPKPCSLCGGDTRIPGTCDELLVSGRQSHCPQIGLGVNCAGYYCQCTGGGTDNSPRVTSTTVIDGATGTVVWEPMTLTEYASLRAKTTVTLTESATATTGGEELETVVAAVFAGGIAWWVACKSINHSCIARSKLKIYVAQSGAVGATLAIPPPSQPLDGSKKDDPTCPSNPKSECQNCGGADSVGLCKSGKEAGCPCDEVQHCPNQPPICSDAACGGDVSS